jgi:sortase A
MAKTGNMRPSACVRRDIQVDQFYPGFVGSAGQSPLSARGRTWLRELGLALVTAGFVVLLFVAYELVGTNLSEENSQAKLAREFSGALAHAPRPANPGERTTGAVAAGAKTPHGSAGGSTARAGNAQTSRQASIGGHGLGGHGQRAVPARLIGDRLPVPPPGGALDHLVIPAIGVSRYVVQGVDEADLQMGPGHYPGTPLPGQAGNVGIAGHRTTFGAPFFRLNEVTRGDLVLLTDTSGTTWVYRVEHQWVVAPTDTAVLNPTHGAVLTLTTCNPRFEATSRLVVRASLLEGIPRGSKVPTGSAAVASSKQTTGAAPVAAPVTLPAAPTAQPAGSASGEGSPTVGPASSVAAESSSGGGWAWLATIGFGVLALLGWVATRVFAARLHRFSKFLVLAAGALVCLVPLWFAFENLVDLLPANL